MSATNTPPKPQAAPASPSGPSPSSAAPRTAKLFKNGRSQAVRLPKEFRFEGKEVAIRRDPATGEVLLSTPPESPSKSMKEWFELFDTIEIPEDAFERKVHMPAERDIF
jgi:antitoxin VapB